MDGGSLAIDRQGKLHTVWRREKTNYLTTPEENRETVLGPGQQPWLTLVNDRPATAWIRSRPGELMFQAADESKPRSLAKTARDPVVAAVDGAALVAWETDVQGRAVIKVLRMPMK